MLLRWPLFLNLKSLPCSCKRSLTTSGHFTFSNFIKILLLYQSEALYRNRSGCWRLCSDAICGICLSFACNLSADKKSTIFSFITKMLFVDWFLFLLLLSEWASQNGSLKRSVRFSLTIRVTCLQDGLIRYPFWPQSSILALFLIYI